MSSSFNPLVGRTRTRDKCWAAIRLSRNREPSRKCCPTTPHSIGDAPTAPRFSCCPQMNWWVVARRVQMGVPIWDSVHSQSVDSWAPSGADVQAPWHSVQETLWLLCDEAQQVGCPRGNKIVRWSRTQASSHSCQGVVDDSQWDGCEVNTTTPGRSAVLICLMDQG